MATVAALSLLLLPAGAQRPVPTGARHPAEVEATTAETREPGEARLFGDTLVPDPAAIGLPAADVPPPPAEPEANRLRLSSSGAPERGLAAYTPRTVETADDAAETRSVARVTTIARVVAYDGETDEIVDITAAARAGTLPYPTHWNYLEVDLLLPRGAGAPEETPEAYEYALVPTRTGAVDERKWVPLVGGTLRITGLPYGQQELRIRSHPPGLPAVIDRPLSLAVARPWYRHPIFYGVVSALTFLAFFAYRRSWQRDLQRSGRASRRVPFGSFTHAARKTLPYPKQLAAARGPAVVDRTTADESHPASPRDSSTEPPSAVRGEGEVEIRARLEPQVPPTAAPEVVDPPDADPLESATLRELRLALEAHYSDPDFSTERLAEHLAVSKRTLSRMTVPLTGLTPGKLIAERRLERARELLSEPSDVQVKAVAAEVGYRSADGFARAFRDRFGMSPSVFSKRRGAGTGDFDDRLDA